MATLTVPVTPLAAGLAAAAGRGGCGRGIRPRAPWWQRPAWRPAARWLARLRRRRRLVAGGRDRLMAAADRGAAADQGPESADGTRRAFIAVPLDFPNQPSKRLRNRFDEHVDPRSSALRPSSRLLFRPRRHRRRRGRSGAERRAAPRASRSRSAALSSATQALVLAQVAEDALHRQQRPRIGLALVGQRAQLVGAIVLQRDRLALLVDAAQIAAASRPRPASAARCGRPCASASDSDGSTNLGMRSEPSMARRASVSAIFGFWQTARAASACTRPGRCRAPAAAAA